MSDRRFPRPLKTARHDRGYFTSMPFADKADAHTFLAIVRSRAQQLNAEVVVDDAFHDHDRGYFKPKAWAVINLDPWVLAFIDRARLCYAQDMPLDAKFADLAQALDEVNFQALETLWRLDPSPGPYLPQYTYYGHERGIDHIPVSPFAEVLDKFFKGHRPSPIEKERP